MKSPDIIIENLKTELETAFNSVIPVTTDLIQFRNTFIAHSLHLLLEDRVNTIALLKKRVGHYVFKYKKNFMICVDEKHITEEMPIEDKAILFDEALYLKTVEELIYYWIDYSISKFISESVEIVHITDITKTWDLTAHQLLIKILKSQL